MKLIFRFNLIPLLLAILAACSGGVGDKSSSSESGIIGGGSGGGSSGGFSSSGSSSSSSNSTPTAVLRVEVMRAETENGLVGPEQLVKKCEILIGTQPGTANAMMDQDSCIMYVPEGELYNSQLRFHVTTDDAVACRRLNFQPYVYRASNAAKFKPSWNGFNEIDCSAVSKVDLAACYNGVGKITPGFPLNLGWFTYTVNSKVIDKIAPSAFSQNGGHSNRYAASWASSYIFGAKVTASGSDGLQTTNPNGPITTVPYSVSCDDDFAENVFQINFQVTDYDCDENLYSQCPNDPLASNYQQLPDTVINDVNGNPIYLNNYGDWTSTVSTIDPQ